MFQDKNPVLPRTKPLSFLCHIFTHTFPLSNHSHFYVYFGVLKNDENKRSSYFQNSQTFIKMTKLEKN